jgi:hypothetical protein
MLKSNQTSYYSEDECTPSWNDNADIAYNEIATNGQIQMDFRHDIDNSNSNSTLNCMSLPQLQFELIDALLSENPQASGISNCLNEIEDLMKNSINDGGEGVQGGDVEDLPSSTPQLPDQSIFTSNCTLMTAEQYEKNMKRALKNKRANETKIRNKRLKKDAKNVK